MAVEIDAFGFPVRNSGGSGGVEELFVITATPESSGAITGTFNKTAAEMRAAIAAGKELIVKLTSSGTVYTYHPFYVTDDTDTLTIGFFRSISGTNAPADEVLVWYSDSNAYNIHERESEEAFRLYLMPTASSDYSNRLFQYCGVTSGNYTEGHFYKVVGSEGNYSWQEVGLSAVSSVNGKTGTVTLSTTLSINASSISSGCILVSDAYTPYAVEINNEVYPIIDVMKHSNNNYWISVAPFLALTNTASFSGPWKVYVHGGLE